VSSTNVRTGSPFYIGADRELEVAYISVRRGVERGLREVVLGEREVGFDLLDYRVIAVDLVFEGLLRLFIICRLIQRQGRVLLFRGLIEFELGNVIFLDERLEVPVTLCRVCVIGL
jgi:hypothetical protein